METPNVHLYESAFTDVFSSSTRVGADLLSSIFNGKIGRCKRHFLKTGKMSLGNHWKQEKLDYLFHHLATKVWWVLSVLMIFVYSFGFPAILSNNTHGVQISAWIVWRFCRCIQIHRRVRWPASRSCALGGIVLVNHVFFGEWKWRRRPFTRPFVVFHNEKVEIPSCRSLEKSTSNAILKLPSCPSSARRRFGTHGSIRKKVVSV